MGQDIKFFCACDHVVDNVVYRSDSCPRCYGNGYYLDVHIDNVGNAVLTTGEIKLQQEMLKIILDEKYKNLFHPQWGSELSGRVGTKNVNINKVKIEIMVRKALEYLKGVQMEQNALYQNLNPDEILDEIVDVIVSDIGRTGYSIKVTVSNAVKEIYTQTLYIP